MDYLTNYYKNLSEQLQQKINILEKYNAGTQNKPHFPVERPSYFPTPADIWRYWRDSLYPTTRPVNPDIVNPDIRTIPNTEPNYFGDEYEDPMVIPDPGPYIPNTPPIPNSKPQIYPSGSPGVPNPLAPMPPSPHSNSQFNPLPQP